MDRIGALVRSAIGFDGRRGDQVEVVNLRFADTPAPVLAEGSGWLSFLAFTKADIMRGVELAVMALLTIVVVLFVVRPLVSRVLAPEMRLTPALAAPPFDGSAASAPQLPLPDPRLAAIPSQTAQMIEIAQVRGQVHAQSIQKVGEIADRNPAEAASIVRQWLNESHA